MEAAHGQEVWSPPCLRPETCGPLPAQAVTAHSGFNYGEAYTASVYPVTMDSVSAALSPLPRLRPRHLLPQICSTLPDGSSGPVSAPSSPRWHCLLRGPRARGRTQDLSCRGQAHPHCRPCPNVLPVTLDLHRVPLWPSLPPQELGSLLLFSCCEWSVQFDFVGRHSAGLCPRCSARGKSYKVGTAYPLCSQMRKLRHA